MDCDPYREVLSARLDGRGDDDPGVDAHVAGCPACQAWLAAVEGLGARVDEHRAQAVTDRSPAILAALADELAAEERDARDESLLPWRAGLIALGVVELALALPVLLLGHEAGAGTHVAREMGSFDVALAVGFLVAAWRPARAWGMVPLVAVLAACLAVTSGVDIAEGRATFGGELLHLTHLLGLVLLWMLAHAYRRPVSGPNLAPS